MNLPPINLHGLNSWKRIIQHADSENLKSNQDVHLADTSLIIESPDGSAYRVIVDNSGNLSTEPA